MGLIDADALIKELEKVYEYYMAEIKDANEHPDKYTSKFIPATAGAIDGLVDAEIVIADAPTIEPDGDTISRRALMKRISEEYHKYGDDYDALQILGDIEDFPSAPSAEAEQVTGKLKNPCDSLLTDDSEACKEQKSKLDLISRQDAINAVWNHVTRDATTAELESLPSAQPSGDLISRESALAEFRDGRDVYDIMESIEQLPSAEPKTGEWIKDPSFDGIRFIPVCSNCGNRPPRIEVGGKLVGGYGAEATGAVWKSELEYHQSDFCPNCGADMRGEEE